MTSAQDEFDALFKDKHAAGRRHPEDEAASSSRKNNSDVEDHHHRSNHKSRSNADDTFYENDDADDLDDDTSFSKHHAHSDDTSMRSRYFLPRQRSEANTGPKGVIADAQAFEQAKRTQRFTFLRSSSRDSKKANHNLAPPSRHWEGSTHSSEEEDNDDEFMAQWRQRRLQELQTPSAQKKQQHSNLAVRMYGRLISVDADGFLEAVECTPKDTVVAVYIYDDMSDVSFMVEECVRQLAHSHPTTRFIKLHFEEAEMEAAGVPALLAYRGGNKFAGLVPFVDEIPDDAELSAATLETVLKKHQII